MVSVVGSFLAIWVKIPHSGTYGPVGYGYLIYDIILGSGNMYS